jgi:cation diffusion facilitator CzcD-associated flavoprotein CzcO
MVGATGVFTQPKPPDIPGLDSFAGTVMHAARWDHQEDLRGRKVAIVGTGASAVQVIPSIASEVEKLTVLQRTPIWCLPKPDARIGLQARRLLGRVPGAQAAARALSQLYVELKLPAAGPLPRSAAYRQGRRARRAAAPASGARPGGAGEADASLRPRLQAPQLLERVPARLQSAQRPPGDEPDRGDHTHWSAHGGRGARSRRGDPGDGVPGLRQGQHAAYPIRGSDGVELGHWWDANRFQAYEGVSVPGFPNMFMILGPYGFNGASYFTLIENQARHIVRCLSSARSTGSTAVEIRPEANRRYFEKMLGRRHARCSSQAPAQRPTATTSTPTATPRSVTHPR